MFEGVLVSLILIDQFLCNMFCDDFCVFVIDDLVCRIVNDVIVVGYDLCIDLFVWQFFYLFFEYSEDMIDQDCVVELFIEFMLGENQCYVELYCDIIVKFGCFLWCNVVFGWMLIDQEIQVMQVGGYSVLVLGKLLFVDLE